MSNIRNKSIVALSVLALFFFAGQAVAQEGWKKVAGDVNKEQDKAIEDAAETERLVKMDEAALKKELANLKARENREERTLKKLEDEYMALRKVEEKHKQDLENEREEIEAIEGNVRATGKDASSLSRDNPITAEYPERTEILDEIINSKRFPGFEGIKTLVKFYFQEMAESGKILRRTGEFVGPDGKNTTGEIIRIGRFTTYYRLADGSVGFLKPDAVGKRLIAVTGDVPRAIRSGIRDYFDGDTQIAPVDLSNGAYFAQLTKSETFRDWLQKGGFVMYLILGVGIFATLLGLERIIVLGTKAKASDTVMGQIKDMANKGQWTEAHDYCSSKSRIPTCQMLDSAITHTGAGGYSQEVLENSLQEAILKQTPKLERFLPTLALLAMISPLLGLLGTVTGMIETFKVITEVGTGDPGMMASGISVALLTTQFGLAVAVPIMLVHHFLKSQVDKIVIDMQEKGTAFAITLAKRSGMIKEA